MNTQRISLVRRFAMLAYSLSFLGSFLFFWWPWLVFDHFNDMPWLIPFNTFIALPLLDAVLGEYRYNWREDEHKWLKQQRWLRALPLLAVPLFLAYQWLMAGYFLQAEAWYQKVGWVLTAGIAGGVMAINIGHELIHRPSKLEQRAGGLLLASVAYGSFKVEHIYGHHTWVATPKDMTTAPKGMTVYRFWWRALTHTPVKAAQIARERAHKQGQKVHELWLLYGISAVCLATYIVAFGVQVAGFWIAQCLVAILLLETVNYIEHYGLLRQQKDAGKYEPITHHHSWNSSRLLTNIVLFNLQRHSDHHAFASRNYPMLRHFDDSPQMPQGYATMILMSLIPTLWFNVMNRRLGSL